MARQKAMIAPSEGYEFDFPALSYRYLRGIHEIAGLRQKVALEIAEQLIRPHLTEHAAIAALDAVQAYALGEIDKKAFFAARRSLTRRTTELEKLTGIPTFVLCFLRTTNFATLFPFSVPHFDSLVSMTINAEVNREANREPSIPWSELESRVKESMHRKMGEIVHSLMSRSEREDWRRQQPRRYRFRDPRFPCTHYENWLIAPGRNHYSQTTRDILDAFQSCHGAETIDLSTIQAIVDATSDKAPGPRKLAFEILSRIAPFSEAARNAIMEALQNPSSRIRFEAVSIFAFFKRNENPREFVLRFLERAMRDRSFQVRLFTFEGSVRYRCSELLTVMKEVAAIENDSTKRRKLEYDIGLVRNGYYVDDRYPDSPMIQIAVQTPFGVAGTSVSRHDLSKMTNDDLWELAEKVRREEIF